MLGRIDDPSLPACAALIKEFKSNHNQLNEERGSRALK
jgi:hypothetical protein